jgi:hypothetical protein
MLREVGDMGFGKEGIGLLARLGTGSLERKVRSWKHPHRRSRCKVMT